MSGPSLLAGNGVEEKAAAAAAALHETRRQSSTPKLGSPRVTDRSVPHELSNGNASETSPPIPTNRAVQLSAALKNSYAFELFVRWGMRGSQASEGGYGIMMANSSSVSLQILTRFILPAEAYLVASLILGLGDALGTAFAVGHDANTKKAIIDSIASYGSIEKTSTKWWIGNFIGICGIAYFFGALSPVIGLFTAYKDKQGCAQNVLAVIKAVASILTAFQFLLYVFINTDKPKKAAEIAQKIFAFSRTAPATSTSINNSGASAPLLTASGSETIETSPSVADYFCKENNIHWGLAIPSSVSRGLIFAFSGLKFATLVFCVAPTSPLAITFAAVAGITAVLMNLFTAVMFNLELNAQKAFDARVKPSPAIALPATSASPTATSTALVTAADEYGWVSQYPCLLAVTQLLNVPASWLSYFSKAIGTGDFLLEVATIAGSLDLSKQQDMLSPLAVGLVVSGIIVGGIANWQWRNQCATMGYKGAPRTLQTIGEDLYWTGQKAHNMVARVMGPCSDIMCPARVPDEGPMATA